MKIIHVVGARPNFMKVAPVISAIKAKGDAEQILVHTGQHYDNNMSGIFFDQMGLPVPDINLEIGSSSHAVQTAGIMVKFEEVVERYNPDLVMVYGDINSTVAAAMVCSKLLVPFAHVEAGLRSFDRSMPEEINRMVTDRLSDIFFTPSMDGNENLIKEGTDPGKIHFVGNVMIDTLVRLLPKAEGFKGRLPCDVGNGGKYALLTLHRPSNVDDSEILVEILSAIVKIDREIPIIFPVHPRTRKLISSIGFDDSKMRGQIVEPLGYLEFLCLQKYASIVITDSGGIQEETTYLGIPCITMRGNTERPVTVDIGTNVLVGQDTDKLLFEVIKVLSGKMKQGSIPELWDGKAGERVANVIYSRTEL